MRLFDFFKKGKNPGESATKMTDSGQQTAEQDGIVVFELQLKATDLGIEQELIQRAVERMVEEDPFQNFYAGKEESDLKYIATKVYQYELITTMNVQLVRKDQNVALVVEQQHLGNLPQTQSLAVQKYLDDYLLTGYAYIRGGKGKRYSPTTQTVQTDVEDYELEITLQFS